MITTKFMELAYFCFCFYLCTPFVSALWPLPATYEHGNSVLWIDESVVFSIAGPTGSYVYSRAQCRGNTTSFSDRVIRHAVKKTYKTVFSQNFVPWKFHPRNAEFEPCAAAGDKRLITSIDLTVTGNDTFDLQKPSSGAVDESYTLNVLEDGNVSVVAASALGIARGLTTLTQLFYAHSEGGVYTSLAPVHVEDAPKFSHRGLHLDVARAFYPVKDILRTIDALAYSKMNFLHVHVTDGQSWPLEVPALPELSAKGAYRRGLTYSPDDIQEIQHFGALSGVEVYLEIDMPGHTSSIAHAFPELVAAYNERDWSAYAAEPPSGTLKLNDSAVYDFLTALFADVLPRVAPYTSYFHTGGDEVNFNAYTLDETVRSNNSRVLQPLLQAFVDHAHSGVRAAGLTPVVWEEMLVSYNLSLGSDVVIQTWQTDEAAAAVVESGHRLLAGNYNYWYLDCGQGQWLDFEPGVASSQYWPYADYCSPRKNWRLMYLYDPLIGIPADKRHLVLGGECYLWSEQSDGANLDRQLWPRACAAGEVLWSGAKDDKGQNRSQIAASPRLAEMRERLLARGVMAEPVRMPFCSMNGTQCAILDEYA